MDLLDFILPKIEQFRVIGYLFIFFISILESLAFIGFTIPGTVVIVSSGFLVHQGVLDIEELFFSVFFGVMVGEWLSFYLGQKGLSLFNHKNKIFHPRYLETGIKFFERHGNKSILIGRFIGILRPVIPFIAGLSKMNDRKFLLFTAISVFVWTSFYLALGYFFGEAIARFERISHRASIFIGMTVFTLFAVYFYNKFVRKK